ncbi:hypothetical protein Lser_V15G00948 [Lactuca serriola]
MSAEGSILRFLNIRRKFRRAATYLKHTQIYWSGLGAWADGVLGREVMLKLFSKERDERLIHHLMASKELHPSLISAQSEYKIMGVLLAAVLRPQEAQCPLVQYITRELLTCLIMEHVMRFASPEYAPVRSDSVVGELKLSKPTDVILLDTFGRSRIPKIEKLEIEGKAFHTNLYAVRCNYSGGKEGETERIIKHMINLFGLVLSVAPSPAPALPPSVQRNLNGIGPLVVFGNGTVDVVVVVDIVVVPQSTKSKP